MIRIKILLLFVLGCFQFAICSNVKDPAWSLVEDPSKLPYFGAIEEKERASLVEAVNESIMYLQRNASKFHFPKQGITHDLNLRSLKRFKEILETSIQGKELDELIKAEFKVYKSSGNKKNHKVLFTGYYEPLYEGSRTPSEEYRYPLYRLPPDLVLCKKGKVLGRQTESGEVVPKYWTRQEIDDEKRLQGLGLELVYLKNPYEVYMAHMQGSVAIKISKEETIHLGYAARNGSSVGFSLPRELHNQGILTKKDLRPEIVAQYFHKQPQDLSKHLIKNPSYVFFKERKNAPLGALSVKVTQERTIATDHKIFPKAALAFTDLKLYKEKKLHPFKHFVLNQDTGGVIVGPGRCDIFFGTGDKAKEKANDMYSEGHLYFLFLKK